MRNKTRLPAAQPDAPTGAQTGAQLVAPVDASSNVASSVAHRMHALARFIDAHVSETLPLSRLAAEANMSPYHLQRSFKAALGVSPKVYQSNKRLAALKDSLRGGDSVTGAIFQAGFGSTSRVYEQVDGRLGMTPSAYRAGGAGETIAYAVRDTALGTVLMAATLRGVCFVHFGDNDSALEAALRAEYPKATLTRSGAEHGPELDLWIDALNAHVSSGAPRPDVPLDLRGTAFQLRVWQFLLSIGEGDVVSYAEAAREIDKPRAVRATASACAANNIAVLVPCHRVLRGDGGLGGYRWGLERKRVLIDRERLARNSAAASTLSRMAMRRAGSAGERTGRPPRN